MGMIDELISLESISLARLKTTVFINATNVTVNIFQNIENEHTYVYVLPSDEKYIVYMGSMYTDNNGQYFFDTPNEIKKIGKVEYKKILRFINSGVEVILTKERVINMTQNKFFNFNLTNK